MQETNSDNAPHLIPTPARPGAKPICLVDEKSMIGRNPANTIHIARGAVSRFHATIERIDDEYVLTDLDSANGTYINERRIKTAKLSDGDLVTFGNRSFLFSARGAEPPEKVSRVTVEASETVRVLGEHDKSPPEVLAREAANATRTFLSPLPGDQPFDAEEAAKAHKRLSLLYQLSDKLRASDSTDEMLTKGFDTLFEAIPADRGVALLRSKGGEAVEPRVVRFRSRAPQDEIPVSRTVLNRALDEGMAVMCSDALDDDRFSMAESIRIHSLRSILCVPLVTGEETIGALHLDTNQLLNAFSQHDLEFAASVANELAISIENQRLQQEAVRNEKMAAIGLTITNVAHNIKNIMLMTKGAEELMDLSVEGVDDPKLSKSWWLVRQSMQRINALSADMLDIARERSQERRKIDVNAAILANRPVFSERMSSTGVALSFDLAEGLPQWEMNETGLQRALLNLVVNAGDAVADVDGGQIDILTLLDDRGWLRVGVKDNGSGIPEERLPDIFQLFFTTKSTGGTGLGLPMVQRFVESMGGSIDVESQVNCGSSFWMTFPPS